MPECTSNLIVKIGMIVIACILILSGSIGVNYHNRLQEATCDSGEISDEATSGEFGNVVSIISIVAGCLYLVGAIVYMVITNKDKITSSVSKFTSTIKK